MIRMQAVAEGNTERGQNDWISIRLKMQLLPILYTNTEVALFYERKA